jgi:hypothetical protein
MKEHSVTARMNERRNIIVWMDYISHVTVGDFRYSWFVPFICLMYVCLKMKTTKRECGKETGN